MSNVLEKEIHKAVIEHWKAFGLPNTLVATIPNERAYGQAGLTKGLPDLLVIAPGLPVGFIELKTEKGKLSTSQEDFHKLCVVAGAPRAVTYGRDEPITVLEHWNVVKEAV